MDQKLCVRNTFAQLQCVCLRFACWQTGAADSTLVVCSQLGMGSSAEVGKRMCAYLLAAKGITQQTTVYLYQL